MNQILKKWIEFAHADLDAAERLFNSPKPTDWTYLLVLWHCHQTVEKMIKMVILKQGKEILKIHDLPRLVSLSELKLSKTDIDFIDKLNKYYLKPRYPDLLYEPYPKTNVKLVKNYLGKTKRFFLCLAKENYSLKK